MRLFRIPLEFNGMILTHWGICENTGEPVLGRIVASNPEVKVIDVRPIE